MKLPKYRAWSKTEKTMSDVIRIDFLNEEVDAFSFEENETEKVEFMSSTGLFDKNGTEIFEGDILKGENGNLAIYRHPTLGFYTIDSSNFECFFADGVNVGVKEFNENLKYISEGLEVIGNVYENPELLEVGQ